MTVHQVLTAVAVKVIPM